MRLRSPLRCSASSREAKFPWRITGDGFARLGGDADLVALRAQPLGQLDGASQHHGLADPHAGTRSLTDHRGVREALLAQRPGERLGVSDPFDEHRIERGARLLAETDGLMAGLTQLPLDALGFPGGGERPELHGEARGTLGRRRRDGRRRGRTGLGSGSGPSRKGGRRLASLAGANRGAGARAGAGVRGTKSGFATGGSGAGIGRLELGLGRRGGRVL